MRIFLVASLLLAGLALAILLRRPVPRSTASLPIPAVSEKSAPTDPTSPSQTTAAPSSAKSLPASSSTPARALVRPPGLLGGGQPVRLVDIPPGTPLRETLDRLPPDILARALARLSLLTFNVLDAQSFRADSTGMIFSVCAGPRPHTSLPLLTATVAESPFIAAASVPISAVPIRHSKPGASRVIYLDFNGHIVSGTVWNTQPGASPSYDCMPYDLDGDLTTFSDEEQTRMLRIWSRVSEDYAPFDVDVTTEEPAVFTRNTARALLTRSTDRNGISMPSSNAGGVAYVDVFGESDYAYYSPAFAYYDNLAVGFPGSGAYASEAMAHELGHNFGLSHDGTSAGGGYYDGHGSGETSWAPIMGVSYGQSITQWSKGEYYDASNPEDDFAIIAAKLGYRTDDTGNTTATARAATISGTALTATGIVETQGDIDVISFTAGSTGTLSLTALPYVDVALTPTHTGNLDIQFELLSSIGAVLTLNSPLDSPRASLTTTVSPGTYYLRITPSSTGAPFNNPPTGYTPYGSRGQYFISGTISGVIFTTFLNQYFTAGEQLDASLSGPAADPDGDGLSNLIEYATSRHPRQPDAPSSATAGLAGSYLTLTYERRLDTSDLTYTVQSSDDLLTWTTPATIEQVSVTSLSATLERVTVRNAVATAPRRFLRLQVSTP